MIQQAFIGSAHAGIRNSIFSVPQSDVFGRPMLAGPQLGQSDQTWYNRAKAAVAKYDQLVDRASRIANRTYRENLFALYHSDPKDTDGAWYRRDRVAADVAQAESYTPINYLIYGVERRQNRVEKLEDWNHDFRQDVKWGEEEYGVLPEPQIITEERIVEVPGAAPGWVLPVSLGLGAIAVAALAGLFIGGGK